MRLILVRHGHSKHGTENIIAGNIGCKGLTEQGIQQAEILGQYLKDEQLDCDVLLSTSVKRAYETATIVADHLHQPIHINDDLRELLPGDADGLSWEQYQGQYGAVDFETQPDKPFAPNGESWNQFVARVKTSLDNLYHTYKNQDVIAVTHAGFIVVSFLCLFEVPFFNRQATINPDYTSLTEWQVSDETWQLIRFNDTHHLK